MDRSANERKAFCIRPWQLVLLLFPLLVALFILPRLQRMRETQIAHGTGVYPACKERINAYFQLPDIHTMHVSDIHGAPAAIADEKGRIIGVIDITFVISGGGVDPEDAIDAYATGITTGLTTERAGKYIEKHLQPRSTEHTSRLQFIYRPKGDTCYFGKKEIDLETGKVDNNSFMGCLLNEIHRDLLQKPWI